MTENDRLAWLQLAFTPYVGAEGFLLLLQRFGSAKAALDAPVEQIAAIVCHKQAAESWRNGEKRALAQKAAEAALQWEKQDGCRLLLLQDDDFPEMLTQGITAPPVLFLRGNVQLLHKPSAAIVGSRHATPPPMRFAAPIYRDARGRNPWRPAARLPLSARQPYWLAPAVFGHEGRLKMVKQVQTTSL